MTPTSNDPKIRTEHLRRQAVVYIRQSSLHQVLHNQESSQRQYALAERARSLGWPSRSIKTVDGDQGRNATSAVHRDSFKTLSAEIADGQVGILLSLEASRLARPNADWHRLVEICVITQTLLADEHAIYDPREPNDRLLLGVKGTISEAEMFTLRCRLHEGRWNKARRGALNRSLPVGYVRDESGEVIKYPDRQVQNRLNYIFRLFAQHKVARRVLVQLVEEKLKIPAKIWGGPRHGQIAWKEPDFRALIRILRNATFAGAYVYGENEYDSFDRSPTTGKAKPHARPVDEWPVCIHDFYPAYITWEQFVENRSTLRSNWCRPDSDGAPRKGTALLQGIAYCGCCGAQMRISHYSTKEKRSPAYSCVDAYMKKASATCQTMVAKVVDDAVAKQFLSVVSPAKIEIAIQALEQLEADRDERCRQWDLQLWKSESGNQSPNDFERHLQRSVLTSTLTNSSWTATCRRLDTAAEGAAFFDRGSSSAWRAT
jgi:DNA invertase Pin-like site-specific DNA recombinase